jgi:hypothetical protein
MFLLYFFLVRLRSRFVVVVDGGGGDGGTFVPRVRR